MSAAVTTALAIALFVLRVLNNFPVVKAAMVSIAVAPVARLMFMVLVLVRC